MASVTLDYSDYKSMAFTVELSNPFNTTYYKKIVVTDSYYEDASSDIYGKLYKELYATSSYNSSVVQFAIVDLLGNNLYRLYFYAQAANGLYYIIDGGNSYCTDLYPLAVTNILSVSNQHYVTVETPKYLDDASAYAVGFWLDEVTSAMPEYIGMYPNGENYAYVYSMYISDFNFEMGETFSFFVTCQDCYTTGAYYATVYPGDDFLYYYNQWLTVTTDSASVTISFDKKYSEISYVLSFSDNNGNETIEYLGYGETISFENLTAGDYSLYIKAHYNGLYCREWSGDEWYEVATDIERKVKITITGVISWLWNWRDYEIEAFTQNGLVLTLTCDRMNKFAAAVDEMLQYKNDSVNLGIYREYLKVFAFSENDNVLTAEKFNAVKLCIGSFNSTSPEIPEEVNPGETVYGNYFITLADKLNDIK